LLVIQVTKYFLSCAFESLLILSIVLMNFLARLGFVKPRKRYEELPDYVLRIIISYLNRETLLSLMATSNVMRKRIQSFRITTPPRIIRHFTVSIRQRDLRLCTRDDPPICRLRAKSNNDSIDILLTERKLVILRTSFICLVGNPKHIKGDSIQEIIEKIMRNSKMDLENVRFLCDTKPFRFQFGTEEVDRKRVCVCTSILFFLAIFYVIQILMILESICGNC
ncbi:hypothetical protein PRIPAC_79173, partial [Pristionchus pacificus]